MLAHTIRHLYRYVGDIPAPDRFNVRNVGRSCRKDTEHLVTYLSPVWGVSKRIYAESHGKEGAR